MSEQTSTSKDAGQYPDQNQSIDAAAGMQSSPISDVVFSTTPNTRICPIEITPWMNLNGCMTFIAQCDVRKQLDSNAIRCSLIDVPSYVTTERLPDVLNHCADLLENVLFVIPGSADTAIKCSEGSQFHGFAGDAGQHSYQYVAIILHDTRNNLFASVYITVNQSLQTCFDIKDARNLDEISKFIFTQGPQNYQQTTQTIDDSMGVEKSQSTSDSGADKVTTISAKETIINRLKRALHYAERLGPQFDSMLLIETPGHLTFVDPDGLSENEKIKIVEDDLHSVLECLQIAEIPSHEEVVENGSIVEMEVGVSYDVPKVLIEPTRHQRNRMVNCFATGVCPLIQGGGKDAAQRTYVEVQVPAVDDVQLYVRVGPVTVANGKHPFRTVVPENVSIDKSLISAGSERSCFKCDPEDYDPNLEFTYLLVTDEERAIGRKKILAYLISWKQQGTGIQKRIKDEKLRLCKLEFCFCVRSGLGQYRTVSSPAYSSVIEDADGPVKVSLKGSPAQMLSEKGGEKIALELSFDCRKQDLAVFCNNQRFKDFSIEKKVISINYPPKPTNDANFRLQILCNEYDEELERDKHRTVYDHVFKYATASDEQPSNE